MIEPDSNFDTTSIADEVDAAFENVCNHIEESGNFKFPLSDLTNQIENEDSLSNRDLFKNLKEKYGDDIYTSHHRGRKPVIYFKTCNPLKLSSQWFNDNNSLSNLEKKTVLNAAAEILRTDIIKYTFKSDSYPPSSKFLDNVMSVIPESLSTFLGDLLVHEKDKDGTENYVKRDYIAHSIVSILRPKTFISNLQIAVGTYVYRKTGSRLIIDLLSKIGVCSSYHSLQLYEASTIVAPPKMNVDDAFVQYVFDNTDHNVNTLDGHETFHCLGGIAIYSPEYEVKYEGNSKKCKKMPTSSVLASQKQISNVHFQSLNSNGLENIEFVSTDSLNLKNQELLSPPYAAYIWGKFFKVPKLPTWKGFFEVISSDITYSQSHVSCLPFINEPPSNLSTLNTALHYAAEESRKLNQKTCFVTFDQPLYYKARSLVAQTENTQLKNIVVRLGGFHLLVIFGSNRLCNGWKWT